MLKNACGCFFNDKEKTKVNDRQQIPARNIPSPASAQLDASLPLSVQHKAVVIS